MKRVSRKYIHLEVNQCLANVISGDIFVMTNQTPQIITNLQ